MKPVLIIGSGDIGASVAALEIMAAHNMRGKIHVVDLNKETVEEAQKRLADKLEEKPRGVKLLEITALEPAQQLFIHKPKKPKYNPKTGKVKY